MVTSGFTRSTGSATRRSVGLCTADSSFARNLSSTTATPSWPSTGLSEVAVGSIEASIGSRLTSAATLAMNSFRALFE